MEAEQLAMQGLSYLNAYFLGRNKDNVRMVRTPVLHLALCREHLAAP